MTGIPGADATTEQSFKERLDAFYDWPCVFMFKFIAPHDKLGELEALFDDFEAPELSSRESKKGNYVSLTASVSMPDSDAVAAVYRRASTIDGVMPL